jgi:predicted YcjX-like family ATPase
MVHPTGLLGGFQGPRTVHLDIVDYPGESLLDLSLLDLDFATWSAQVLSRLDDRPMAGDVRAALAAIDPLAPFDEPQAQELAGVFTTHLNAAREAGFSDCTPGRFLLPGDLEGSPVVTFAPLPLVDKPARKSLWREFERRFESYKRNVVRLFSAIIFQRSTARLCWLMCSVRSILAPKRLLICAVRWRTSLRRFALGAVRS